MFDTIGAFFVEYSNAVKGNPMLAGFALYLTGALTYLARNLPKALWEAFSNAVTTSIEMNNAGYTGNDYHFTLFLTWFMESPWSKWSRSLYTGRFYQEKRDSETVVGPGYGNHIFFFKGRLFWFNKFKIDSSGSERVKEGIRIVTLGRSHKALLELVKAFEYKKGENEITMHEYSQNNGWSQMAVVEKRSLDTVCIPADIKALLLKRCDQFVHQKEWFKQRGIAYKITTLFYGPPGTGKTSIVKALASHYNRNVYTLDLSAMSNRSLQAALASLPAKAILLMEDVDAASNVVNARDKDGAGKQMNALADMVQDSLTLAGLLNALDGIVPLHDVMVFMNTNHPEKLDPALTRKSRVDYKYEIGPMTNEEIHEYVNLMYPGVELNPTLIFNSDLGCNIQAAFRESPDDVRGFLKELKYMEIAIAA
jgi:chaperone BCS1